jgi:hypothetical protein
MRISEKNRTIEQAADFKQLARQALEQAIQDRAAAGNAPPPIPAETMWKIKRLFARLTEPGAEHALTEALNAVVSRSDEISRAAIVWIDLLDVLVNNTEARYGATGRGKLKKEEVKTVVAYLIRTQRFNISRVPGYVQAVAIDVMADFAIDALVSVSNTHDLWAVDTRKPTISELYRRAKQAVGAVLRPLVAPLGRFATWLYFRLRYPAHLSPALRDALAAVEKDGMIAGPSGGAVEEVMRLKLWVGENAQTLVALVQLASIVVQEVEGFLEAPGPEKKAYAKQVVFEVLGDLGFDSSNFFLSVKVEAGVDMAIDSIVHLFNKRNVFSHSA